MSKRNHLISKNLNFKIWFLEEYPQEIGWIIYMSNIQLFSIIKILKERYNFDIYNSNTATNSDK